MKTFKYLFLFFVFLTPQGLIYLIETVPVIIYNFLFQFFCGVVACISNNCNNTRSPIIASKETFKLQITVSSCFVPLTFIIPSLSFFHSQLLAPAAFLKCYWVCLFFVCFFCWVWWDGDGVNPKSLFAIWHSFTHFKGVSVQRLGEPKSVFPVWHLFTPIKIRVSVVLLLTVLRVSCWDSVQLNLIALYSSHKGQFTCMMLGCLFRWWAQPRWHWTKVTQSRQ